MCNFMLIKTIILAFSFHPLLFLPCPVFVKVIRKRSKAPLPRDWEIAKSLSVCLLYKHEHLNTIPSTQVKSIKAWHSSTVKLTQENLWANKPR